MRPLRIYLDSSDYSVLSDPRRESPTLTDIKVRLQTWVNEGAIECYFSGIHLSEMAPLDAKYADAAERRADLLVSLCGRRALISAERLFAFELEQAIAGQPKATSAYSSLGEWYPEGATDILPIDALEQLKYFREAIRDVAPNRKARRLAERKAVRHGRLRSTAQSMIHQTSQQADLSEILDRYPMRPEDARVISRFVVGQASAADASAAFAESLRDPRWMMRWFALHHDKFTPFIEWTRKPAESMLACVAAISEQAERLREFDASYGTNLSGDLLDRQKWLSAQNELVQRIATRMAQALLDVEQQVPSHLIDAFCPGLSVAVRSLHSSWYLSTTETPRSAKKSDFADALHAVYAPYVDFFRADTGMAPSIMEHAAKYSCTVVSKLVDLPSLIQSRIGAQ